MRALHESITNTTSFIVMEVSAIFVDKITYNTYNQYNKKNIEKNPTIMKLI